jgi:polyisoprenoid-binding protein YceI
MRKMAVLIASLAIVVSYCFAEADAANYAVDTERSELVVRLFKGGIAAAVAHNHVIRAVEYSGGAKVDPDDPEAASIWVDVQTASFKVDEPEIREKFGLSKSISDGDRQKIQAMMLSAKQMDIERYPTMRFVSMSVEAQSEGRYLITGDLTIHGVTRSIIFPVTVEEGDRFLRGSASIDFKQSDFGIEPYSALFGAVRNRDEAILYANIVLLLESEGETRAH